MQKIIFIIFAIVALGLNACAASNSSSNPPEITIKTYSVENGKTSILLNIDRYIEYCNIQYIVEIDGTSEQYSPTRCEPSYFRHARGMSIRLEYSVVPLSQAKTSLVYNGITIPIDKKQ